MELDNQSRSKSDDLDSKGTPRSVAQVGERLMSSSNDDKSKSSGQQRYFRPLAYLLNDNREVEFEYLFGNDGVLRSYKGKHGAKRYHLIYSGV